VTPCFVLIMISRREEMKNKKLSLLKLTKESPKERKARASSGIQHRAAVFENKKKREKHKKNYNEEI